MMGRTDTQRTIGALQVVGGALSAFYGGGAGQGGGLYLIGSGIDNLSGDKHGTGYVQGSDSFLKDLGGYGAGALGGLGVFGSGGVGSGGGLLGSLGGMLGMGKGGSSSTPPPASVPNAQTAPPIPGPSPYDEPRTQQSNSSVDPTLLVLLNRPRLGTMV